MCVCHPTMLLYKALKMKAFSLYNCFTPAKWNLHLYLFLYLPLRKSSLPRNDVKDAGKIPHFITSSFRAIRVRKVKSSVPSLRMSIHPFEVAFYRPGCIHRMYTQTSQGQGSTQNSYSHTAFTHKLHHIHLHWWEFAVGHIKFDTIINLSNTPNMNQYNLGVSDTWKDTAWKTII